MKTCPINGCPGTIEYDRIMCEKHWFKTPIAMRPAIWETLWAGQTEERARLAQELIDFMNEGEKAA